MASLEPGSVLADRFEVVGVLGRGGMATVVLALDRVRGERVALKVLHAHLATDTAMRGRLRREVIAAGRLRHPHALVAYELHELDDTLALSMPLHQGQTLADYVATQGPLTGDSLRRLGVQLAGALAEAHRLGIVHRDVTPSNIMVDASGEAVLTDFGLARLEDHRTATASGVMGTTGYVAPEVFDGVRADPRSDVYSLGAVLYTAATGTAPFAAATPMGVLQRQLDGDHLPLGEARPDLPEDLAATVEAMLHLDRQARVQGAGDVVRALEARHAPEAAPEPEAPPRAATTALVHPSLPAGEFTVVVRERGEQRRRRDRLRRRRRRAGRPDAVEEVIDEVRRGVLSGVEGIDGSEWGDRAASWIEEMQEKGWSGMGPPTPMRPPWRPQHPRPASAAIADGINAVADGIKRGAKTLLAPDQGPEEALAGAVATEAELPPDALSVSPVLYKRRFRLVGKVDRATALRLASRAREQGFRAEAAEARVRREGPLSRTWRMFWALVWMIFAMSLVLAVTQFGEPALMLLFSQGIDLLFLKAIPEFLASLGRWPYLVIFLLYFLPLLGGRRSRTPAWERFPVAYEDELGTHLAEGYRLADAAATPEPDVRLAQPEPHVAPPEVDSGPLGGLLARTWAQLDGFDGAVTAAEPHLADFAVAELRGTVAELRRRAENLAAEARRLEADLERTRATEDVAAASRVEARLERLKTLAAAGQGGSASEIAQLERSLAAHCAALEATEALEGRLTVLYARLLEIGSTATQARRELLHQAEPTTATRLLAELRREAGAAAEALAEVDTRLPREEPGEAAGDAARPPPERERA